MTIWSFASGYITEARWKRKSDFPDEGGEVMRIGERREVKIASCRNASIAEGVGTTSAEEGGEGKDLSRSMPWILAVHGLAKRL